jgi:crotonobetainyl-CoA:carnitine CoA-transferase CaiB-like acyl-CoA transferase
MTPSAQSGRGSLAGLRVIEIGTSVAAPYAAQILGDFGADVVKVERIGTGDDSRSWAPPQWNGVSVTFLALNRSKRSLVVDYKTDAGKKILESLISESDVLIQNLRPGALAAAGFDAAHIRALNPRLIYCELSGFGAVGPRASNPAYDPLVQAFSGIVSITGDESSAPSRVPVSLLDMGTGMWAALAVFEALRRRDQTGSGSHVQLSLLQTALTWLTIPLMGVQSGSPVPGRQGSGLAGVVPYGAFPSADGYVFISAGNNQTWNDLLDALSAPHLKDVDAYSSNPQRVVHREGVTRDLSAVTSQFTSDELVDLLAEARIPHSPVQTLDQVLGDEQVNALGQFTELHHDAIADFTTLNLPMTFDGVYPRISQAPPALGADTQSVLASLGLSEVSIADLLSKGIVQQAAVDGDRMANEAGAKGTEGAV